MGEQWFPKLRVGGSIPSQSAIFLNALLAQLVEHRPSKSRVTGSSPVQRSIYAKVAQLVERFTCNEDVVGSNPAFGSIS